MDVFHEGLSDRAPILLKEAERVRLDGLAAIGEGGGLPTQCIIDCARLLASAYASVARGGYRPEYKRPVVLGFASLQLCLNQFTEYPTYLEDLKPDSFNRDAYKLLEDWTIDVARTPDMTALGDVQKKAIASGIHLLGVKTISALEVFGTDAVDGLHLDAHGATPSTDAGATRIDACMAGVAKACRSGPFAHSDSIVVDDWYLLSSQLTHAYASLLDRAEEVSEERDEVITAAPHMAKKPEVAKKPEKSPHLEKHAYHPPERQSEGQRVR